MFNWFKNEKSKSQNEKQLDKKIKEVKEDYKDYFAKGHSMSDEQAKELAQIRTEIESKYGEYRNPENLKHLKTWVDVCHQFGWQIKFPETIYKQGGCKEEWLYEHIYPEDSKGWRESCEDGEKIIKYIMEGNKCHYVKNQKSPIQFWQCQNIGKEFNRLIKDGHSQEKASDLIEDKYRNGMK